MWLRQNKCSANKDLVELKKYSEPTRWRLKEWKLKKRLEIVRFKGIRLKDVRARRRNVRLKSAKLENVRTRLRNMRPKSAKLKNVRIRLENMKTRLNTMRTKLKNGRPQRFFLETDKARHLQLHFLGPCDRQIGDKIEHQTLCQCTYNLKIIDLRNASSKKRPFTRVGRARKHNGIIGLVRSNLKD